MTRMPAARRLVRIGAIVAIALSALSMAASAAGHSPPTRRWSPWSTGWRPAHRRVARREVAASAFAPIASPTHTRLGRPAHDQPPTRRHPVDRHRGARAGGRRAGGRSVSLVAYFQPDGSWGLTSFTNDLTPTGNAGRVVFRNTAAVPAVDVQVDGGPGATALSTGAEWPSCSPRQRTPSRSRSPTDPIRCSPAARCPWRRDRRTSSTSSDRATTSRGSPSASTASRRRRRSCRPATRACDVDGDAPSWWAPWSVSLLIAGGRRRGESIPTRLAAGRPAGSGRRDGGVRHPRFRSSWCDGAPDLDDVGSTERRTGRTDPAEPIGTHGALLADTAPPARPHRGVVPVVGLQRGGRSVGVVGDELDVPKSASVAGWYRSGPVPGSSRGRRSSPATSTSTVGAVPSSVSADLRVGDPVVVTDAAGSTHAFVVTASRRYPKSALPAAEIFRQLGPAELTLITCGGEFRRALGSYADNVVVHAAPSGI